MLTVKSFECEDLIAVFSSDLFVSHRRVVTNAWLDPGRPAEAGGARDSP
jgi:hypothetical protein